MRKLSTIRKIADVQPIENADAIEVATVDGWKVVVKKGEFQVGDLCVYLEIDSVLPIREEFEFLRKGCYVKKDWLVTETNPTGEGFRLKTIKLRGQISQGLIVPLNTFLYLAYPEEGMCIDGITGVVKWEPPVPAQLAGRVKGNFPSFIPKTDQERIQNLSDRDVAPYLEDEFEITLKLDGSSMTVFKYNDRVGVCSRNLELDWENDPDNTFVKVFVESGLKDFLFTFDENIAIQGELMGPGIQGNRETLKEATFFVFDIYDIDEGRYKTQWVRDSMVYLMARHSGINIQHVPIVGHKIPVLKNMSRAEILDMADGKSLYHDVREGLVFKSIQHPEFSFKAISNKYLLKGGE